MESIKIIKFVISALFQDAGEATRAIELARGLREECPPKIKLEVIFLSHEDSFNSKIQNDGFEIFQVSPKLPGIGFRDDLKTTADNMIGDEDLAYRLLQGEVEALKQIQPDVFIHGFWPIAGIGAKLARVPLEISYLPIPFEQEAFSTYLMKDIPDFIEPLTRMPAGVRKFIMSKIPKSVKLKAPMLKQENILKAYARITGKQETPEMQNLFDMLKSDFTIVNDFPIFYEGVKLPEKFKVVGPLYSPSEPFEELDIKIRQHFDPEKKKIKIFCTLGSSGGRENLIEAIKALTAGASPEWDSVVLCPASVCPIQEAQALAAGYQNIYITDAFVPALKINSMADLVVSHGGQGTVQTAIASGTPIVGFAAQPEQQINLDNIVMRGAAIRIPVQQWKAEEIRNAIIEVSGSPEYKQNMKELQEIQRGINGKKNSAIAIWEKVNVGRT